MSAQILRRVKAPFGSIDCNGKGSDHDLLDIFVFKIVDISRKMPIYGLGFGHYRAHCMN